MPPGCESDLGDVALLEKHEATRHGQQRCDVGGHEIFTEPKSNDDGTAFARDYDRLRILFTDDRERVGAFELLHRLAHGPEQVARRAEVMMDAVNHDLGVGLGAEAIA